jgi:multiple sugar transport system ATP-binding protein
MTLAPAELVGGAGPFATVRLGDGSQVDTRIVPNGLASGNALQLGLRPENVTVAPVEAATTTAKVDLVERLGDRTLVYAHLSDGQAITAEDVGISRVRHGDTVGLKINGDAAHLFGPDGEGYHPECEAA